MDSAGAIAGPLIALALLSHYGLRGVFWVAAVPGFAAILVVLLASETGGMRRGSSTRDRGSEPHAAQSLKDCHSERSEESAVASLSTVDHRPSTPLPARYYHILFAVGLFSLGNSSDMFLVLRAQSAGIPAAHAPLLGLVFNLTYTAFSWPAGKLADRVSKHALVAGGYAVFAVVYGGFALATSRAALWAMMSLYGLFYAFTAPVLKSMVVENAPPEARGRAFGFFYFVTSIAALLSSILTGELWKHYGPELPFLLSAALAALAAVLVLIVPKLRRNK
jgi:MFS family permease